MLKCNVWKIIDIIDWKFVDKGCFLLHENGILPIQKKKKEKSLPRHLKTLPCIAIRVYHKEMVVKRQIYVSGDFFIAPVKTEIRRTWTAMICNRQHRGMGVGWWEVCFC